ncbi:MAG: methyl-accepting chemotaxis protein [Desulfovibrio sp.]|jgi:methyl-accepting chemotaxis protein|nr:methyl-accepting chemotaxis protein [Desulfovibrio sp.]
MSIRSKLLTIFSILALGGPCLLMIVVGWQARRTGLDNYLEASRAQMERANNYIELFFVMTRNNARYIADTPEVRQSLGKLPAYVDTKQPTMPPAREEMTPIAAAADKRLEQIVGANPQFFNIGIGLKDGGFLSSPTAIRSVGYDPRTRGWYKTALAASSEESYGNLYRAVTGNMPVCTVMARIRDTAGAIIGASYININLDTMTKMISAIRIGKTGQVTLVEGTGVVIASDQFKDSVFTNIADGKIAGLEDALKLAPGSYVREVGGVSRVVTLFTGFNNWRFLCVIDESEVHEASTAIILWLAGITLALVLLSLALGWVFAHNLAKPISYLAARAERITHGEFNVDIHIRRKDEIGQLGSAFTNMLLQLKERLGFAQSIMKGIVIPFAVVDVKGRLTYLNQAMVDLWGLSGGPEDFYGKTSGEFFTRDAGSETPLDQRLADRETQIDQPTTRTNSKGEKKFLRVTTTPLWDMDGHLLGACMMLTDETEIRQQQDRILALNERITTSVKEAHDISGKQEESFNSLLQQLERTSNYAQSQEQASVQTMESITAMSNTLEALAATAEQTSENTQATRAKAEEGKRVVGETVEYIKKVAKCADRTAQGMQELGVQADGINAIVELIKDIADQTNLLALNAAIEAARAGESGRGFAVVADEVRKLAEKTMHATEDVNKSISALQTEVNANRDLTDQTVTLTRTATDFAEQSGKSLVSIVEIAGHAVGEVRLISETTSKQAQACAAVVGAMRHVSDMARETTRNMEDSAKFVEELARQSGSLKHLVESMGADRRRAERFVPDSPCMVTITGLGQTPLSCRVMDIALLGVRVEARDKQPPAKVAPSAPVRITASGPPLNAILDSAGHLMWQDGVFFGIEFEKPLTGSAKDLENLLFSNTSSW